MNICVIASSFHPTIGGAESFAYTVAEGLAARGHRVQVLTDGGRQTAPYAQHAGDPRGVDVQRFSRYRDRLEDPSKIPWEELYFGLLPEVQSALMRFKPDIVLTNSLDSGFIGSMITLSCGLPWIATFHEHAPEEAVFGVGRMRAVLERLQPDLVLAGSKVYAERARQFLPPDRVALIYHGIDDNAFRPDVAKRLQERARLELRESDFLILSVGRLKERKGLAELLQAFHIVKGAMPEARLVIAGSVNSASSDYSDRLDADIARLGLAGIAHIDRHAPFDQMPALYAAADLVVQPSYEERLGLAVLEAMSSETPCVVTEVEGIVEILSRDDIAFTVATPDPHLLSKAILLAYENPEQRLLYARNARAHVKDIFSLDAMLSDIEGHCARLTGKELT